MKNFILLFLFTLFISYQSSTSTITTFMGIDSQQFIKLDHDDDDLYDDDYDYDDDDYYYDDDND